MGDEMGLNVNVRDQAAICDPLGNIFSDILPSFGLGHSRVQRIHANAASLTTRDSRFTRQEKFSRRASRQYPRRE